MTMAPAGAEAGARDSACDGGRAPASTPPSRGRGSTPEAVTPGRQRKWSDYLDDTPRSDDGFFSFTVGASGSAALPACQESVESALARAPHRHATCGSDHSGGLRSERSEGSTAAATEAEEELLQGKGVERIRSRPSRALCEDRRAEAARGQLSQVPRALAPAWGAEASAKSGASSPGGSVVSGRPQHKCCEDSLDDDRDSSQDSAELPTLLVRRRRTAEQKARRSERRRLGRQALRAIKSGRAAPEGSPASSAPALAAPAVSFAAPAAVPAQPMPAPVAAVMTAMQPPVLPNAPMPAVMAPGVLQAAPFPAPMHWPMPMPVAWAGAACQPGLVHLVGFPVPAVCAPMQPGCGQGVVAQEFPAPSRSPTPPEPNQGVAHPQAHRQQPPASSAALVAEDAAGAAQSGHRQRTTVMLRNLPSQYTRTAVRSLLDREGFGRKYDFLYAPCSFKTIQGLGFCFVNMTRPEYAEELRQHFTGFCRWDVESNKVCEAGWSSPDQQGLQENIKRYRNSSVMHPSVPQECKPMKFVGGMPVAFPMSTRKVWPPHDASSAREVSK